MLRGTRKVVGFALWTLHGLARRVADKLEQLDSWRLERKRVHTAVHHFVFEVRAHRSPLHLCVVSEETASDRWLDNAFFGDLCGLTAELSWLLCCLCDVFPAASCSGLLGGLRALCASWILRLFRADVCVSPVFPVAVLVVLCCVCVAVR